MSGKKKPNMSRDEARQLYDDLQKSLFDLLKRNPGDAPPAQPRPKSQKASKEFSISKPSQVASDEAADMEALKVLAREKFGPRPQGAHVAILFILLLVAVKVGLSAIEATGIISASPAIASQFGFSVPKPVAVSQAQPGFSKEEVKILTSLDQRRSDLEERSRRLDDRQSDIDKRDREFAAKLTQLRELTQTLKIDREKNEKKRDGQLDQLANVYGSMGPQEAATLIEQLDITIALSLLERMPEKRIGQILALMKSERALQLTRMLSGKFEAQ